MSFRYRLLSLTADDFARPEDLFFSIVGVAPEKAQRYSLTQWLAVVEHLQTLGAVSLLVQNEVRDPDFSAEYDAFYARQHRPVVRHCHRLHAFSQQSPHLRLEDEALEKKRVLEFVDAVPKDSYLGFVTLRPLRHAPIGPTILRDSSSAPSLAKDEFPVHIAGVSFSVHGTPFMQQDDAVGACAQASIWMALRTLRRRTGNAAYSTAELTLAGTRLDRISPGRHALSVKQMLDAIQASGHDPLIASVTLGHDASPAQAPQVNSSDPAKVLEAVQPYIFSGLPVILIFRHPLFADGHAAVAIGQVSGSSNADEDVILVIHNDNAGPYRLLPRRATDAPEEYALDQVNSLIVPLPNGVAMTAVDARVQAQTAIHFWMPAFQEEGSHDFLEVSKIRLRLYLCARHAFRRWARECEELEDSIRETYRTRELPQYVWVVEIHDSASFTFNCSNSSRLGEVVLDANADARHGDAVLYIRLTHHMFLGATVPGSILVENVDSMTFYESSNQCAGLLHPWSDNGAPL